MAKVLLIQRERIFLTMHGRALAKADYEVIGKDDFDSGKRALAASRPSVVLCGFHRQMTDEDLEHIRALRAMRPDVPLILLCYRVDAPPVCEAMMCGASLVVQRELSSDQLVDLINRVCRWNDDRRYAETYRRPQSALVSVAS